MTVQYRIRKARSLKDHDDLMQQLRQRLPEGTVHEWKGIYPIGNHQEDFALLARTDVYVAPHGAGVRTCLSQAGG